MYIFNNGKFSVSFSTWKYKLSVCLREDGSYFTSICLASYICVCIILINGMRL